MSPEFIFLAVRVLAALLLYAFFAFLLIWLWRDFHASQQAAGVLPKAHLVIEGSSQRHTLQMNSDIGRAAGNTVRIQDETISARHARLMFQFGQWWIEDLASRNGTEVNGIPVDEAMVISYGDQIQFGRISTRLESGEAVQADQGTATVPPPNPPSTADDPESRA
jgi:predicted component of type VI protein secretion system